MVHGRHTARKVDAIQVPILLQNLIDLARDVAAAM